MPMSTGAQIDAQIAAIIAAQGTTVASSSGKRGVFSIVEMTEFYAGAGSEGPEQGERFDWTSDRRPQNPVVGGARAAPIQPWTLSGKLNMVRTNYTGARQPSVQVLSPIHQPFTWQGRWDDRYNFLGYAVAEMKRFEAMCFRGNRVRLSFQNQVFEGLITDWKFPYHRDAYIRYEFTFDVHQRAGVSDLTDRSPKTALSPAQHWNILDLGVNAAIQAHAEAPSSALAGVAHDGVAAAVQGMSDQRDVLGQTLDQHDIGADLTLDARSQNPFRRIATQFRTVSFQAAAMRDTTLDLRADTAISVNTAMSVLDFESWHRSVRYQSRTIIANSARAASDTEQRDRPNATRLYRPQASESLYAISRRFYGTPHSWRLIADANSLKTKSLTGNELLIIPEQGRG